MAVLPASNVSLHVHRAACGGPYVPAHSGKWTGKGRHLRRDTLATPVTARARPQPRLVFARDFQCSAAASPSTSEPSAAHTDHQREAPVDGQRVVPSQHGSSRQDSALSSSQAAPSTTSDASRSRSVRSLRKEAQQDRQEICDKLISVFAVRKPEEWRKLIAFSKQWPTLVDSLFARIEGRSQSEKDDEARLQMKRLLRRLRAVHEELAQYNGLVAHFRKAPSYDWEGIVASQRAVLTAEFFKHMENLIHAAHGDSEEQEELAEMATKVLSLVQAYDRVARDQEAMEEAALTFENILQVNSLAEMDAKVDELAASGRLDPALLLTLAKAYNSTKDTDATKEEVKDIMAHLYFKAKETFAAQQPAEVRILKHLLTMDDQGERNEALSQALTPGPEVATDKEDYLATTPQNLLTAISAVLSAYDTHIGSSSMLAESSALMRPEVIERMRQLEAHIRQQYT